MCDTFSQKREVRTMQNVIEIYNNSISRLPNEEQLELASIILNKLVEEKADEKDKSKVYAIDLLEKMEGGRLFKTSEEADEYLRWERDSWES